MKKNEIRLILILANLSYDKPMSKTKLCTMLKINPSSLNRDLLALHAFLTNQVIYDLPKLTIVDNHILLEKKATYINKNTLLTLLLKELLLDSFVFQIIDTVVRNKSVSALEVSDNISISLSYLNQSLTSLNKFLSPYKIRIRNKQNQLEIIGALEHVFFFSYLFIEMSNKLFEEKREKIIFEKVPIATFLHKPEMISMNSREMYQFNTFIKLVQLYELEFNQFTLDNPDIEQAISDYTDNVYFFNSKMNDSIRNQEACNFLNFLSSILYAPINHRRFHLEPFEKMKVEKTNFMGETLKLSAFLLTYVPFISEEETKLIEYATYLYGLYLSIFGVNIYELFDPTFLIKQSTSAAQKTFPTITLPDTFEKNADHSERFDENSLLYPIYLKHSLLFSELITYLHRKELATSLSIVLYFPDNPAFQYYLTQRLSQIFQADTFTLTQDTSQADIIVSDQFHFNNTYQYFYYFPDPKSETLLIDLCHFISKTYLTIIYEKGHQNIALLNHSMI
ncbi:helix-turn-helix domain-containing protein [Vagococcus intermedius]|uniref:Helix-turn-helix domain-containing protein n=1 Tax=Vagococcus intermedius TaxID=2991418 RepID=A0AAF0CT34_9ENTE|nr:helix-turn-helix domain-containing protein [Vagococcus intermedius]WEG72489.1 helix-turn-helix domain-containing protein [Vagococcus intermedius]